MSRIDRMIELEVEIFGESEISKLLNKGDKRVIKFKKMIDWLDNNYFNTMSSAFFFDKVKEEIGEAKVALDQYKSKSDNNARHLLLGEISDFILATSSALDHDVKYDNIKVLIDALVKVISEGSNIKREISQTEIFNAHYDKIVEIYWSVNQYFNILKGDRKSLMGNIQTKIRDDADLKNPANKMKIVKEIRRMFFALCEVGVLNTNTINV